MALASWFGLFSYIWSQIQQKCAQTRNKRHFGHWPVNCAKLRIICSYYSVDSPNLRIYTWIAAGDARHVKDYFTLTICNLLQASQADALLPLSHFSAPYSWAHQAATVRGQPLTRITNPFFASTQLCDAILAQILITVLRAASHKAIWIIVLLSLLCNHQLLFNYKCAAAHTFVTITLESDKHFH